MGTGSVGGNVLGEVVNGSDHRLRLAGGHARVGRSDGLGHGRDALEEELRVARVLPDTLDDRVVFFPAPLHVL